MKRKTKTQQNKRGDYSTWNKQIADAPDLRAKLHIIFYGNNDPLPDNGWTADRHKVIREAACNMAGPGAIYSIAKQWFNLVSTDPQKLGDAPKCGILKNGVPMTMETEKTIYHRQYETAQTETRNFCLASFHTWSPENFEALADAMRDVKEGKFTPGNLNDEEILKRWAVCNGENLTRFARWINHQRKERNPNDKTDLSTITRQLRRLKAVISPAIKHPPGRPKRSVNKK
ncbi:MAG: hypothetical protein WCO56_26330 [Verrucomicrobiota bacterium]